MGSEADIPDLGKVSLETGRCSLRAEGLGDRTQDGAAGLSTEAKLALIKRNLHEITDEEVLDKIVAARSLKIYWGTATTGQPHIAYFLPFLKLRDFVSAGCSVKILLADIHAFLDNLKAPMEKISLRVEYYKKLLVAMLDSLGVSTERIEFVNGSSFQLSREYTFDLYRISSYTTIHDSIKAGAEVVKQAENPLLSSLIYPNMQVLDEEYLGVDAQFGGVDQRKIFMQAHKYMPKLGYKRRIHLMNPMMPGLNSEKMSSSDELSKIGLQDSCDDIRRKIKKCFCEPGNTKTGVLTIFKYIVFPFERFAVEIAGVHYKCYQDLESTFARQGIHPGDLKACCADIIDRIVAPVREAMATETELIKKAYK